MAITKEYLAQVELLLKVLPIVKEFDFFALKGGTAINLFIRNIPRLSVDIDLVYLLIDSRDVAFKNINDALKRICTEISNSGDLQARLKFNSQNMGKIFVNNAVAQIKIEPSYNLRGTLYDTAEYPLCPMAVERFGDDYSINIVSLPDLYAGKICAALDRKHPRDLFDIKLLLEEQPEISDELLNALVVYLVCSNRPIHELLNQNPNFVEFDAAYSRGFTGMADIEIPADDLRQAGLKLLKTIHNSFAEEHKQFLVSMADGMPDWKLINIANLENFPGIRWKLQNIKTLKQDNSEKHKQSVDLLDFFRNHANIV